jgi:hypothetical protein
MWKKAGLGAALLAASLALGMAVLLRQTPLDALISVLRRVDVRFVLGGLALMACYVAAEAMGSRAVLRALGDRALFRRCLGYSMLGFCCASVTPSSSGGQPAQIWAMSRDGIPVAHGSLAMLLLAVCYQTAMLLGGLAGCLALGGVPGWGGVAGWLLLLGAGVNLTLTAGMLALMFLPGPARFLLMGGVSRLERLGLTRKGNTLRAKAETALAQYARGVRCIRCHPTLALRVLGCACIQLACLALVPWMVCMGLGIEAHPLRVAATQAVLTLSVAAFPMPGSAGAAEGGFLTLFAPIVGAAMATPAMLLSRGISFYLFLPICCGLSFWGLRRRRCCPAPAAVPRPNAKAA